MSSRKCLLLGLISAVPTQILDLWFLRLILVVMGKGLMELLKGAAEETFTRFLMRFAAMMALITIFTITKNATNAAMNFILLTAESMFVKNLFSLASSAPRPNALISKALRSNSTSTINAPLIFTLSSILQTTTQSWFMREISDVRWTKIQATVCMTGTAQTQEVKRQ